MGVYSRLSDIVNSNVHALLDKAEDPAKMVRMIIQEMEDTLVEVRSSSVKTIARQKQLKRELLDNQAAIDEWQDKAELAMSKNREDLARAALMYKKQLHEKRDLLQQEQALAQEQLNKLDADIRALNEKLKDAKARQRSLLMRNENAGSRLKAKQQVSDTRIEDAKARFEAFERKIENLEAQVDAEDLGTEEDLERAFSELQAGDELESELAELRKKVHGDAA